MKNLERNRYNANMNRHVSSGRIRSYPSYEQVMLFLGERPKDTAYFKWILGTKREHGQDMLIFDFFWSRRLLPATLNRAYALYDRKTSRQQIKKALQKLSVEDIENVLQGRKRLEFRTPYKKSEEIYKSFVGQIIGSYKIIDLLHEDHFVKGVARTSYCFVVRCEHCGELKVKRASRFSSGEGKFCLKCTYGLNRPKKHVRYSAPESHGVDTRILWSFSVSEYSRYNAEHFEEFMCCRLDDVSSFTDVFGTQ